MSLGQRIKERRTALDLSVKAVADHCGVKDKAVYQWEDGSSKGLKPENLVKTAEILKTYVRWLVFGTGPKEKVIAREELEQRENDLVYTLRTLPPNLQDVVYELAESLSKVDRDKGRKLGS